MVLLSAATTKRLRSETGASLMDCRDALLDADRDFEAARRALLGGDDDPEEAAPVD